MGKREGSRGRGGNKDMQSLRLAQENYSNVAWQRRGKRG